MLDVEPEQHQGIRTRGAEGGRTDTLEIIFDTVATSRKHRNLGGDPRVALVTGRGSPTCPRYSDFTQNPPRIVELGGTLA